ncbi:hypothetical protein A3A14_01880 [Candidatus Daviesbacteria bacterium RIFCSPLOWO2_01_FULL_43_38]|uniref:Uncharacterized protein n=2 Tax=Candidatus Daviesiibacteriota TaxID=1752718 RepID=A0A1F5K5I7_9BACT|nr:MAG: hypothetical protein UV33_C0046G0008 [Candidatus Daviesbacteria bacterium GW2011_GWA1_42_6]OGE20187.1 MAG: hypothetical protein A2874_03390 [Candidatus Daviesbacteria bacterium RIFCSPHIGHO2_01_FULL_43_17]OGE36048.1 MAG: hypothetical protein A3E45_03895 [Candidatus Daviesbacteria bacterium RIFCSPHIGHO2_12_FULL_43_11]OGE63990.1 MAG: hypothetical protein A3A14_01880 [Candidatus Daviesbacteria bacterium RIFCSPLOWO2_01_FULL_43_38]OGE69242.1 MAG: hypothetical protein A3J21_02900 [Candidatus D
MSQKWQKIIGVVIFGVFFGLLEAIVVVYLREVLSVTNPENTVISPDNIAFSLGLIAFLKPSASLLIISSERLLTLELWREASTIIMLITLAWVTGKYLLEKLAYFFLAFAVWDICYYIFLYFLTGRPGGLSDSDIFFLIPVAWVGPVITPVAISSLLIVLAFFLLLRMIPGPGEGGLA